MSDEVKAGQVWQHKNTGARVGVVGESEYGWVVRKAGVADAEERTIPEWLLTGDFILVKDAP